MSNIIDKLGIKPIKQFECIGTNGIRRNAVCEAEEVRELEADYKKAVDMILSIAEHTYDYCMNPENYPDDYDIPIADLEAAGIPASGRTHQSFYSRGNGGGAALAVLGYRATLNKKEGILAIVRLPEGVQAKEEAAA